MINNAMTQSNRHNKHQKIIASILGLCLGLLNGMAVAAPGTLSNTPLYLSTQVQPNIIFIADDSISMDWGLQTNNTGGYYTVSIASNIFESDYNYSHPTSANILEIALGDNRFTAPRQSMVTGYLAMGHSNLDGLWRLRSTDYNKIYYNPAITYKPWLGTDTTGSSYAASTPTAAYLDPYLAASVADNTVDLTSNWTYNSRIPDSTDGLFIQIVDSTFYPAFYNQWSDTNSNGIVDASDSYTTIEIKSPSSFTGSSNRYDCAAAPTCTYAEEIQNFANWFSYYHRRAHGAKNAISSVVASISSARVGYTTLNNTSVNTPVSEMNIDPASGNKKSIMDNIFSTLSTGTSTPLRGSLKSVGDYYEAGSSTLFSSAQPSPILPSADGGTCQHNFTVLVTDGYYNGASPLIGNSDGDNNSSFDGSTYGDTINNTLADVAMHYYERDLDPSMGNSVPTRAGIDEANHQHMVTYTVGFGVQGTLDPDAVDPGDAGFTWPDPQPDNPAAAYPEKIDDLWHTAYNGRGQFLNALNPEDLSNSLSNTMSSIVARSSSAAAVAFNSTTLGTGSVVYLARFNSATWSGELLAHDLDPFTGQVAALPSWNSATQLDAISTSSRTLYTYNDDTSQGVAFRTLASLSARQQSDLNTSPAGTDDSQGQARIDYLRGSTNHEGLGNNYRIRSSRHGDIVHSNPVYVGRPLMNYPDTDPNVGGYFDTLSVAYSTFKIANKTRTGVIYVGANDGMLHGFNEDSGDEIMGYLPNASFTNAPNKGLHYLTDPNYIHQYYVDLSPTVADAHIQSTPTSSAEWTTVLLGGMRSGGRGIFALDITDPAIFNDSNADNVAMWEFTSDDDPDMGYSFSKPTIALMNNDRWAAIFGNGYNSTGDYKAKLFIAYLDGGINGTWVEGVASASTADEGDYMKIEAHNGNISISSSDPNGLSTPQVVDLYANGRADWIYAGDIKGNLWVFDVTDTNADNWDIAYSTGQTPKPLFTAMIGTTPQPITSKPIVTNHPSIPYASNNKPDLMVYFGTGQFLVEGDKTSVVQQTMYGVWDKGTKERSRTNLVPQTFQSGYPATSRVTSDDVVNYASSFGWYIDLKELAAPPNDLIGERIVVNPKVRGDYVFFNTLIPNSTPCSYGGSGWLLAVKQINGGPPSSPVYDANNDGVVNDDDLVGDDSSVASGGLFSEGLPAESNFLGNNQYTPGSSGELQQDVIDAGIDSDEGRLSWKEVIKR